MNCTKIDAIAIAQRWCEPIDAVALWAACRLRHLGSGAQHQDNIGPEA
jgi:hypothetical protein